VPVEPEPEPEPEPEFEPEFETEPEPEFDPASAPMSFIAGLPHAASRSKTGHFMQARAASVRTVA
jgi:hypothetical protein